MTHDQQPTTHDHGVVTIAGNRELLEATANYVLARGGKFSLRYDIVNRLAHDDEPAQPGDDLRWTATARIDATTYTGTARIDAGEDHSTGLGYACVRLLRDLGRPVSIISLGDQEPSR